MKVDADRSARVIQMTESFGRVHVLDRESDNLATAFASRGLDHLAQVCFVSANKQGKLHINTNI